MFRKPKKKVALRQPIGSGWEDQTAGEENEPVIVRNNKVENLDQEELAVPVSKPPALLSFDHDEGADVEFTVKKNKKKIKDLKRRRKLEEDAEAQAQMKEEDEKDEKEITPEDDAQVLARETENEENNDRRERAERHKYLDRYRDGSSKGPRPLSDESEPEVLEDDAKSKFKSSYEGIPDSRAVYEAKKRRERMRKDGNGFIPLDDDKKLKEKGRRDRLVREDDNDDSDEDAGRFYSSRELVRNEDDRKRCEQNDFLVQEQGDVVRDSEIDAWEKQQIRKGVSRHTIGMLKTEYDQSAMMFAQNRIEITEFQQVEDMDMDIDMEVDDYRGAAGPANTGGVVSIEDIMAKLKLRMNDREEALNARREEVRKMETNLEENKQIIQQIKIDSPVLANKFAMYQEMRVYVRSLLDCLNEKVAEINDLADKRRVISKARTERLLRRRRRDIQDQYGECSAAASGKNVNSVRIGDAGVRAAEREARRARRRRERQSTLAGISHEEGLSSDDDETTSQQLNDQKSIGEVTSALDMVFVDALDDFSQLHKVLERMIDWLAVDGTSFQDAYVHLCIPKLASPYVRIELIRADLLNRPDFILSTMQWYVDAVMAGTSNSDVDPDHDVIVGLIPMIVDKVVLPFLIDVVTDEWDPMSFKQTSRLAAILNGLSIYPTLTSKSKSLNGLLEAVKRKVTNCIDEDLFVPMFGKQALDNVNTGCLAFLDRQFWGAIKLLRCVGCLSEFLSQKSRFELAVDNIINKACVLGIQLGALNDISCERKVRALIGEIPEEFLTICATPNAFRSLISCLGRVADEQKKAGREFHREVSKFLDKLKAL